MNRSSHTTQASASRILAKGGVLTLRPSKALRVTLAPHARTALMRRGDVVRVGRGVYQSTARRDAVGPHPYKAIAGVLQGEPYFISWWSALAHYGLTEQRPLVVQVAVQSQHRPQVLAGYEVQFVRLKAEKFRGLATVSIDGVPVRIAAPERAVLDCLDRPDLGGGLTEVVKALVNPVVNSGRLVRLALELPSDALVRRLGYLMSVLEVGDPSELLKRRGRSGYTPLDPGIGRDGQIDRRWSVIDNIGADVLRRWASRDT